MTERLDRIEAIQESNARAIESLTNNVTDLSNQMMDLKSSIDSVLGRNAITNDMILELRAAREQDQRNFEQHQAKFLCILRKWLESLSILLDL